MADIQFDDVTKRYDDGFEAVKHMNLEHLRRRVHDPRRAVSGCGKSTALRMIAGLEDITDGELRIGDQVVNDKAPKDRDIAMVFQNYALYPHMTVRDNMGFALKIAGEDKATINQKVEEAATHPRPVRQHLDRKPANLSGGQRQRVAMGRAIVRNPKAFLMDEPLSNLDAKLRVQMRTEVSRIQQRLGTTTVYVTHDQTEAMTLGDRVAVMRAGQLQQVDTPKELYNNPRNIFVAGFIGSPAMNFFTAHVEGGKVRLPFGEVAAAGGRAGRAARSSRASAPRTSRTRRSTGDLPDHLVFEAPIDLVESMGSEIYAYFAVEAPAAQSDELAELAADSGLADVPSAGGEEAQVVARLAPESEVKEGSKARLALDTTKVHLFDPSDGTNIAQRGG